MNIKHGTSWTEDEFEDAQFKDERLKTRVIKLVDRLSEAPESPINQACLDWAETKAAYRFFRNDSVEPSEILASHINKTVERAKNYQTILAIQDTTYFSYAHHKKTKGLGILWRRTSHGKEVLSKGLVMHTAFAVTTEGLPLGILDQNIYSHPELPKKLREEKKRSHNITLSVEDKASFRWIESLINCNYHLEHSIIKMITVCDREGDIFDLFDRAFKLKTSLLIRAAQDRLINKPSRHSRKPKEKLWKFMKNQQIRGRVVIDIPSRGGRFGKPSRSALLDLRFGSFSITPPRNHPDYKTLTKLNLNAIYVIEQHPPKGEDPLEWMLLTDLPINDFDSAAETVRYYSLRFRIETLHRILKSGFLAEQCRLSSATALIRYLTVLSIASWRIFWITIIGRSNPDIPCTQFLTEAEWKVLYSKIYQSNQFPHAPITARHAIHLIGRLGGFLDRKGDNDPGVISLWRGWRRLCDLADGWELAKAA
jgi:hypothetical protein